MSYYFKSILKLIQLTTSFLLGFFFSFFLPLAKLFIHQFFEVCLCLGPCGMFRLRRLAGLQVERRAL